ncbi:MAG: PD40 domain-containing protein [Chloroflexota bacterium]|nr:PD40 domain-containing protein [Chloroflexota bacterium]
MKHLHRWIIVLIALIAVFVAPSILASAPTGAGPNDPLMVPTSWQTIAPNTTLWFYFDYVPDRSRSGAISIQSRANVAVDANGVGGIQLSIYTPDQANAWLSDSTTAPIGRGTPFYDTAYGTLVHDLYWSGAFNLSGRYLIAIANNNSVAVQLHLSVTGDSVSLYPAPSVSPTPTLFVPITVTPVPTATIQGKLVFETATGGWIYTVNGDGSNLARVSHGIDPSWSPDGKQITFARWDNTAPGLYIANADGSNEQILFTSPRIRSPRWSPDGKYIAFTQDKTTNDKNPLWKLGVVEVATGKLTEPQCSRLCYLPSWGSDSATLAFYDPSAGIMATNIFSGPAWHVLGPTGFYFDTVANFARPILHMPPIQSTEWSPDGKQMVYSQQAHDRWELNTVNADGSNATGITNPDPILSVLFDVVDHNVAPTWSPDSKQILFLSDRSGKWEFFVVNADGTGLTQVLKNVTDSIPLQYGYSYERMIDWTK